MPNCVPRQRLSKAIAGELRRIVGHAALRCIPRIAWDVAPSRLAVRMAMTKGAISKLAGRLLEKSLIGRRANRVDRRAHTLALSAQGRALEPRLAALADENDEEFFGALAPDERQGLEQLLRRIARERGLAPE